MNVLHLCGGSLDSGASRGVIPLHEALLSSGVESKIIYSKGPAQNAIPHAEPFFKTSAGRYLFDKSTKWIEPRALKSQIGHKVKDFSMGRVGHPWSLRQKDIDAADIIHLHWVNSRFLSIKAIQKFNKPLVWTLRDAWPYTGGCHYTQDCTRHETGCGACPQLGSQDPQDVSSQIIQVKRANFPADIEYVALSQWTADQAQNSALLHDRNIRVIPNAIDSEFFASNPKSQASIRKALNLPSDATLILAGAARLGSPFKGYDEILPKIPQSTEQPVHLVTFGRMPKRLSSQIQIPATHLGSITDTQALKDIYKACDLFIAPSKQEAFGKTLAEAGACGLPVICYDSGGPRDIVIDGMTGMRVPPFDNDIFVHAIVSLCKNTTLRLSMQREASKHIRTHFCASESVTKYVELYRSLAGDSNKHRQAK